MFDFDWADIARTFAQVFFGALTALIGPLPQEFEQWLLSVLQGIVSAQNGVNLLIQNPTDWITQDSDVISMFHDGVIQEVGLLTLVLSIQAFRVMTHRIDVYEAVFRAVFFCIIGESTLFLADKILTIINIAASHVFQSNIDLASEELPSSLELGAMLIVGVFFGLLAWVKGAIGVVFLKVLVVSAPYILVLSTLPLFEGFGKWWAEEFTVWSVRPFFVALTLRLGLGLAAREGGPIGLLFTIVTFWLAYTMDSKIRRFSVDAWGSVAQLGLFARGARMFAGAGVASTAAAPAAAAATAAAHP